MILKRTWRPELSSVARLTLIAIALAVLPSGPRAFSQVPPPPTGTSNTAAEPKELPVPAVTENEAPPQRPVPSRTELVPPLPLVGDSAPLDPKGQVIEVPYPGSTAREPVGVPPIPQKPSTEERLDRLEAMLKQLLTEMKNQPNAQLGLKQSPVAATPEFTPKEKVIGAGGTQPPSKTTTPTLPNKTAPDNVYGRTRLESSRVRSTNRDAANADIKAKLVDLEFEIQSLELQLRRAQAQRELLQKQWQDTKDNAPAPTAQPIEGPKAVPTPEKLPPSKQ